jgi:UPF0716 protein FxsA
MRFLMLAILLAFPVAEVTLLVRLAEQHGWLVLAWLVLSACAGIALIKEARFALVSQLAASVAQGRFAVAALVDSGRTVLAGLLLIFPGVISDLLALMLLLLPSHRVVPEPYVARMPPGKNVIDGEFRRER